MQLESSEMLRRYIHSARREDDTSFIFSHFGLFISDRYCKQFAQVRYQNDPQPLLSNMVKVSICHVTVT